jgi:choline/glycine/proline betaine transport protein
MPPPSPASATLAKIGLPDATSRIAVSIVVLVVLAAVLSIEQASALLAASKAFVVFHFDTLFVATANLSLVCLIVLALHPSAAQRLGKETDRPEFSRPAWFAMLFSAGLASGLLYWATAEPLIHFRSNPLIPPDAAWDDRVQVAIRITMVHWGLHGWALYVVVALALALPSYRQGRPLAFRTVLYPLLGDAWIDRWPGRLVDLVAVFGTICGVATSIGLSATSMNSTLSALSGIEVSTNNQVVIIGLVCALGVLSALSGVARGIRWLSSLNAWVSLGLMLAFLFLGPTREVLSITASGMVDYVVQVVPVGLWLGESEAAQAWQGDWTIFYWAWWLAWTPFVSLFIARISRGRTVREFTLAVSLVPTGVTLVWMGIFGATAILQDQAIPGAVSDAVNVDYSLGLVAVIKTLGGSGVQTALVAVATFLLFTWLVTSLDSATLVMCHLLGVEEIPAAKIFWGFTFAAVSAILLVAGGLAALQAASIVIGLPLALIVILVVVGLIKELVGGRA